MTCLPRMPPWLNAWCAAAISASGKTPLTTGRSAPEVTYPARSRSMAVSGLALKVRMRRGPWTADSPIATRVEADKPDGDHPSVPGQPASVELKIRAHCVDDHVERSALLGGGVVTEDPVGAEVAQGLRVAVTRERGDVAAHCVCQLHGGGADAAGRAADENSFASAGGHPATGGSIRSAVSRSRRG